MVLVLLAALISIYLFTFNQTVLMFFPAILSGIAISLQTWLKRRRKGETESTEDWAYEGNLDENKIKRDFYYSVIAIAAMLATSILVGYISYAGLGLSVTNAALFGVEAAIAEEMLFRGVIFSYLLYDLLKHPTIAMIGSAVIFMIYHQAVYGGNNSALLYVLAGGFILAWVTYRSGNLAASMVAHSVNNILAAVGLVTVANKYVATTYMIPTVFDHNFFGNLVYLAPHTNLILKGLGL
jgi:membrane protease YdiL (CAAX protease family)